MKAIAFVVVGQQGTINGTCSSGNPASYPVGVPGVSFLTNDAAVLTAWNEVQAAGSFTDGNGNLQTVSQATYYQDVILNANGGFDGGNVVVTANNPYFAPTSGSDTGSFDFTGDVSADGNLTIDGNGTIGGTFAATGNTSLGGTLAVTGATTLTGATTFGAINIHSNAGAITAHAGGGQGSATALTKSLNQIATVVTTGDSVVLPTATAGRVVHVANAGANSANVFPATGATIDAGVANAAKALAAGKNATFFCPATGAWYAVVSA